jgi:hypothetical protein
VTGVTVNEMAMIFPFSAESGLALGFTQPPTQQAAGTLLLGIKYSENEADDSSPNAEVNTISNESLLPPIHYYDIL